MSKLFISNSNDPAINLATEEYLTYTYNCDEPIVFIWQNANTIVVGRNQNTHAEINTQKVNADNVTVVRRNTGGGSVFHDMGNICYSIIIKNSQNEDDGFENLLQPILKFLKTQDLNAQFTGRNDIQIDGFKISGNAKLKTNNKTLLHGTLLFDVDLTKLGQYLIVNEEKIKHQKVKSKSSRVKNMKEFLQEQGKNITIKDFYQLLIDFYRQNSEFTEAFLTNNEKQLIESLANQKYRNWEWVFGKNSDFTFSNTKYLEGKGLIQINMTIQDGIIKDVKIFGDFLGYLGTEQVETKLINAKYEKAELTKILTTINLSEIFSPNFEVQDLLDLIF